LFEQALEQYRRGEFRDSLSSVSNALREHSSLSKAYALRAQLRHILGDREGSLRDAERAGKASARTPEELAFRGNARVLSGEWEDALGDFNRALEEDEDFAEAALGRARVHRAANDLRSALRDIRRAVKLDPNHLVARYHLAWAYHEAKRPDRAKRELTRILNRNRRFALAYGLLGTVFAQGGDRKRAQAAYSKAIRLFPDYSYAYLGRAMIYLKSNQTLADKDFQDAIRTAPSDYAPYFNRGEIRHRRGDPESALSDFRVTLKMAIPHPPAAKTMGERFAAAKQHEEAAAMFGKAIGSVLAHPDRTHRKILGELFMKRSVSFEALEETKRALADLDDAVRVSSGSALVWTTRAEFHLRHGNNRLAGKDLDRAIELDEKYAPALMARGKLKENAGRYEEALVDFKSAIETDDTLAEAYSRRGRLLARIYARYRKAVIDFARAAELKPRNASYALDLGVARLRVGDFWKSVESLDRSLLLKAPEPIALRYRAEAYYGLGDVAQAAKDIEKSIQQDPNSSESFTALGQFRMRSRLYPQAITDLDQAISLDRSNGAAYRYRGQAYAGLGEYRKAIRDFQKAVKYERIPLHALALLCHAERLAKREKSAIDSCNRALRIDEQHAPALLQRGLAFMQLGDYARSVRDLDDALRLDAPRPQALLARSIGHAALRQYKQSDRAYREAMMLDFQVKSAELTMGEDPGAAWDYSARIDAMEGQLERDGEDPYTHLVRGNALDNAGHYDRAIIEYTRALEIDGKLTQAYIARGSALAAQDSLDAAEQDLRRAVRLSPEDPLTHLGLVTLLTARRKYPQGLKIAIEALRLQGEDPDPNLFVKAGNLRYFSKKVSRARENFQYAIKFSPMNASAYNGLGLCEFSRGQYQKALANFSKAIKLHPDYDRYYRNRAATFVNLGMYQNAAADYKLALTVNRDPSMVDEYQQLIKNSEARIPANQPQQSAKGEEKANSSTSR
jgi:tetratricopeptide (TPR) repeat protein